MRGGEVVEGVPSVAAFTASPDRSSATPATRVVKLAGIAVDLADVRRATVIYPAGD